MRQSRHHKALHTSVLEIPYVEWTTRWITLIDETMLAMDPMAAAAEMQKQATQSPLTSHHLSEYRLTS